MSMFSILTGLVLLATMGAFGVVLLCRIAPVLNALELIAYGIPLGTVCATIILLGLASFSGLHTLIVIMIGVACVVGILLLWPPSFRFDKLQSMLPPSDLVSPGIVAQRQVWSLPANVAVVPVLVISVFALRWAIFWSGALHYQPDGLWAGHINIWGDWPVHLGDVSAFVYSDNFPPQHPRYAGRPYDYHYLAALTAAMMVKVGIHPPTALTLHSFVFSFLILLGLYAFARRLALSRGAATLALVLFLLGGSLAWVSVLGTWDQAPSLVEALLQNPWDRALIGQGNFKWENMYFSFIVAQRGYLYGLPFSLLIFTLLFEAVQTSANRYFIIAGCVAGLLPLTHLSTLLALAVITPFLFVCFPRWRWILFFLPWVAIAVPLLQFQQGGEQGATDALRIHLGWLAAPDNWLWFWLKNLGWFWPLLALAWWERDILPPLTRRFLLGFMPVFGVANIVVFQPWDWDNHKLMVLWFLAVCLLVAALITKVWNTERPFLTRLLLSGVVLSMILSGLLVNLQQLLGRDRYRLSDREEMQVAEAVLAQTPSRAIFTIGSDVDHPIPTLTGRRVLMGYWGWLWTHGIDYGERERDLKAIYAYTDNTPSLLAKYNIDYVVIGPVEREQLQPNVKAFRQRYPQIITTPNYEIFAVSAQ